MKEPVVIVDVFGEVIAAVEQEVLLIIQENEAAAIGKTFIETIDYQYGHKRELIQTLFQMDASKNLRFKKYPLVYLVQDFAENIGNVPGIYADVSLNVIIAHHTKKEYKITDRYEQVFKPVLYPIYKSLIKQLAKHPQIHVQSPEAIKFTKWDRSQWGRQAVGGVDEIKLTESVDAIELERLQLKIKYSPCKNKNHGSSQ